MKRALVVIAAVVAGFGIKVGVVEAERLLGTHYVDACQDRLVERTMEANTKCYGIAKQHLPYRIVAALNFQPQFWKNTERRCLNTEGTRAAEYFECGWWNRFGI